MKQQRRSFWSQLGTSGAKGAMRRPSSGDLGVACLDVWSNTDWAGDVTTRQSQSSVCAEVDGVPVFSTSRRQAAMAGSSGEAELYAAPGPASEALLTLEVLLHFGMKVRTTLWLGSAAALGIANMAQ